MSTFITAPYVGQLRNEYSENLLSYESTFNNDLTFVNNSGATATINGTLSLVIISSYQKEQNGTT